VALVVIGIGVGVFFLLRGDNSSSSSSSPAPASSGSAAAGSSGAAAPGRFAPATEQNFMNACVPRANQASCGCLLTALENTFSQDGFAAFEQQLGAGDAAAHDKIEELANSCSQLPGG
jgi:hypothetical protein